MLIIIFVFFSSLKIKKEYNKTLPEWAEPKTLDKIIELGRGLYYFYFYTKEMARLVSGGILNEMRNNMISSMNRTNKQKVFLYSGVDLNS